MTTRTSNLNVTVLVSNSILFYFLLNMLTKKGKNLKYWFSLHNIPVHSTTTLYYTEIILEYILLCFCTQIRYRPAFVAKSYKWEIIHFFKSFVRITLCELRIYDELANRNAPKLRGIKFTNINTYIKSEEHYWPLL